MREDRIGPRLKYRSIGRKEKQKGQIMQVDVQSRDTRQRCRQDVTSVELSGPSRFERSVVISSN